MLTCAEGLCQSPGRQAFKHMNSAALGNLLAQVVARETSALRSHLGNTARLLHSRGFAHRGTRLLVLRGGDPLGPLEAGGAGPEALGPVVGGFSQQHLSYWEIQATDPWVVSTLTEGYNLQFRRRPPTCSGIRMSVVRDPVKSLALSQEVTTLLGKGAIERVDQQTLLDGFYSIYFLIPKKDGGLRPILDLRGLNQYLKVLPFHMLRTAEVLQAVAQGDWFTSIDLKDAYFHVPIAPHHRRFLRFAFLGQAYQFRVLPFGLSLAPRVFTRCVAAALSPVQARGITILPYLDDWLIVAPTRERAVRDTAILLSHVTRLGLTVNYTKSSLTPSQRVVFLGVTLDSQSMRASLSPQRVEAILNLLLRFRENKVQKYSLFLRLAGMLAAASAVVPLGLLSLRPLQIWMNGLHLDPKWHKCRKVWVSKRCLQALRPWRRRSHLVKGVPLGMIPSRREVVVTDSSLGGWGAVWQNRAVRGLWGAQQRLEHINVLELRAVYLALRHFIPALRGKHVLIRTDNTSTVYQINHQGGTRSMSSLRVTQRLLTWAFPQLLSLRAMHIPGLQNQVADFLSRQKPPPGEWRLHPEVVEEIWGRYGKMEVDLFASAASTHCPLWFSLKEATSPLGQDALAHTWPNRLLYAFPPTPLILATLDRVRRDNHRLLLVAPNWPGRPWFPVVLRLLDGTPLHLPRRRDLLSQLDGRIWHPNPDCLQLCVWPLRGQTHS